MHRIERYGVIALVFLLVTVAAVTFWGDGAQEDKVDPGAAAGLASGQEKPSAAKDARPPKNGQPVNEKPTRAPLPLDAQADARPASERALAGLVALEPNQEAKRPPRGDDAPAREGSEAPVEPAATARPKGAPALSESEMELVGMKPNTGPTTPVTVEYTVKPGDTLSGIALATLGSTRRWEEIASLNANLDPSKLQAGQKIRLPKGAVFAVTKAATPAPGATRTAQALGRTYTVAKGDVLSGIAARMLGSAGRWREIAALNPKVDPERLFVGTVLTLPADAADANAAATTVAKVGPERSPAAQRQKEFKVR